MRRSVSFITTAALSLATMALTGRAAEDRTGKEAA